MRSSILLAGLVIFSLGVAHAQINHNITLLGHFDDPSLPSASGTRYNEVWGYVDCELREYAILGSAHYVHFFNLENPASPQQVASFTGGATTIWRDMKTFRDRAYSVCDQCGEGLMVFDLSNLPNSVTKTNQTPQFFQSAHNIFIDENAGRLYVAGSNTKSNGVIILDLNGDPDHPTMIGNPSLPGGYIHDIYVRNNIGYCSSGNNGYWVYNFSNPQNPVLLGTLTNYPQSGYNHSSWLNGSGQYAVMADETHNKGLKMLDVSDLTDITVTDVFRSALLAPADTASIPHNPFIRDNYVFVSYYHDGVQVFDMSDPYNVQQVAWYDTYPGNTNYSGYEGCWGVYAFLPSGTILGSDMSHGLYILSLDNITLNSIPHPTFPNSTLTLTGVNPFCEGGSVTLSVTPSATDVEWYRNGVLLPVQGNPIQVQEAGWYKATIYNEYCAVQSDSVEVKVIPLPDPTLTPIGNPVICEGGAVVLSVDPSATTIKWYRNGVLFQTGNPLIQVQQAGIYYAILYNQSCQIQTNSVQVQVLSYPDPVITLTGLPVICEGESVLLSADPSATAVDWYLNGDLLPWEDTQIEVQAGGGYYAVVYNQFCSVQTNTIGIQVIPLPNQEITLSGDPSICDGDSVLLSVDPYATVVQWYLNGQLLPWEDTQIEVQEPGVYSAFLANQFCSTQSDSVEIQVLPFPDPGIAVSGDPVFCAGNSTFLSVDPTATAIEWYQNGELLSWEDPQIEVQESGVYSAVLFNQSCAIQTDSVEIQVIPLPDPEITLSGAPVICAGNSVWLSADTTATSIEWFLDGQSLGWEDPQIEVQEPGVYSATLYNQFCEITSNSQEIQVIPLPSPEISVFGEPSTCEGGSVVLSLDTSATAVEWYLDGVLQNWEGTQIEAQEGGVYSATLFNQFCEKASDSVEIQILPFPNPGITLSGEPSICEGESVLLSVDTSATAVEWYLDGVLQDWEGTQIEAQEGGVYSATVFNQFCEIASDSVEVQVIPLPNPGISLSGEPSICEGESVLLSVDTSATAVEWYLDGVLQGWEGTQIEAQEGGVYSATLFNQFCEIASDSVEIQVVPFPDPGITLSGEASICEGESVLLSVDTSATSVKWYLDGVLQEWEGTQIEVQEGGVYSAIVFNQACSIATDAVEIQVIPAPNPEIGLSGASSICEGESVLLSVDPAATSIEWFFNGESLGENGAQIEVQEAGAYFAILSNQNCTIQTDPVDIEVLPLPDPELHLTGEPIICKGDSGLLSVDTSATAVEWYLNGQLLNQTGSQLEVQEAGWYAAILFNQSCPVQTDSVEIQVLPAPAPEITLSGEPLLCEGESVLISVDSTAAGVDWYLNGELLDWNEPQIEAQQAGWYYAILSNQFCDIQTDSVEVQVQQAPEPTLMVSDTLACLGDSILLSANEELDTWQWLLDGTPVENATQPIWWTSTTGQYAYTGVLGPCAVSSEAVSVQFVEAAVPVISFVNDTLFATPAATYQWFLNDTPIAGATSPYWVPSESGFYSVQITDENGCDALSEPLQIEIIDSVTGQFHKGWKIYPNPATDWLVMELPGVKGGTYSLYDCVGRMAMCGKLEGNRTEVSLYGLLSGVYFLEIQLEEGRGQFKVVVAQ
ncbi:MAG: choice-of-anchor B family protein [Lewinellaceae bacterium]|nr:choice-of-anchor B family protein [Lewinellaceae bacterium]